MKDTLTKILPRLEKIRKEMHQNPEVSMTEVNTSKRIISYLNEHCNGEVRSVAKTGVTITFDSGKPGKKIMLRSDIDALPIAEVNTFEYKSNTPDVSHKCGHDGHAAMMMGVADLLTANPIQFGKVTLLFQPGEEDGMGAEAVLADEYFKNLEFDFVFALHNIPGKKKGQIILKENIFNANVKSMIVKLNGRTAHAAEPEKGENPALAMSDILKYCDEITNNVPSDDDFFLITPVHLTMGEIAYGISAGAGELHLTIRSWDLDLFDSKCNDLEVFITKSCEKYDLKTDISWTQVFYANKNHPEASKIVRSAAEKNKSDIYEMEHSFKWGEDFGLFTQKFKGAMFGLGAGENTPALHNPDYDFPDDITADGIQQFYQIIQEFQA
jgi:amidohydrolase